MRKRLKRLLRTGRWRRTVHVTAGADGLASFTADEGLLAGDRIIVRWG